MHRSGCSYCDASGEFCLPLSPSPFLLRVSIKKKKKKKKSQCRRTTVTGLLYAWDAFFIYNNGGRALSIHFVCGETRRPAGNCFATPVLVGRDTTAAIVVNEMRESKQP